jgi:hypothetical protein
MMLVIVSAVPALATLQPATTGGADDAASEAGAMRGGDLNEDLEMPGESGLELGADATEDEPGTLLSSVAAGAVDRSRMNARARVVGPPVDVHRGALVRPPA